MELEFSDMKMLKIIFTLAICATAILGDYIVFKSKYSQSQTFRAFTDSIVHAGIGLLSSLIFFVGEIRISDYAVLYNIIFCTLISSLIDIDHVLLAKSLNIKDLMGLKQRGIFHCTSLWLIITTALLIYSHIAKQTNIYILTWMLILAYTSHHIRDGNRRGLWLYPLGHTPAISYYLYIFLVAILPHLWFAIYKYNISSIYKHNTIEYTKIVNVI